MRYLGRFAVMLMTALLVCTAGVGYADTTSPPSTSGWSINPTFDGNIVSLNIGIDNTADLLNWDGLVTRTWGDPTLSDPSKYIAIGDSGLVLKSLTVGFDGDPVVSLSFHVDNTSGVAKDVRYSALLDNFGTINKWKGRASAGITVTDCNGDGATATGIYDNGCFYKASYNTKTSSPQPFKSLITGTVITDPDCGDAVSQNWPWQYNMPTPISDMKAEFGFTLSPYDSASGTSVFTVVSTPEPGTVVALLTGMLGMGGFALRRRRA